MKTKWLCCFELWIHVGTNPFSLSYESLFCLCRNTVNVKSVFCLSRIGKRGTLQWVYQLAHFPQPNGLVKRCGRATHLSGASSQLGQNSLTRSIYKQNLLESFLGLCYRLIKAGHPSLSKYEYKFFREFIYLEKFFQNPSCPSALSSFEEKGSISKTIFITSQSISFFYYSFCYLLVSFEIVLCFHTLKPTVSSPIQNQFP